MPVNPPDAPKPPRGDNAQAIAELHRKAPPSVGSHKEDNCYPAGTDGYQSDCVGIGFEGYAAYPGAHWGIEPYYGTGKRYVFLFDELAPGSRERAWLQWDVNQFNSWYSLAPGNNRPYILYYQGEQYGWANCAVQVAQFPEVCYDAGQVRSRSNYFWDGRLHFTVSLIHIGSQASSQGDYYTEYSVVHEMGHLIGIGHNQDCLSAMTYCGTYIGRNYLNYHGDDLYVYGYDYDPYNGHTN